MGTVHSPKKVGAGWVGGSGPTARESAVSRGKRG